MTISAVIEYAKLLLLDLDREPSEELFAATVATPQLLREYPGPDSDLYRQVVEHGSELVCRAALTSLLRMHDAGVLTELSLKRRAQADVLADIFDQADVILDGNDFNPAAAAVLIGGALEQFLRAWVDEKCPPVGTKRGIDAYAAILRSADLITKTEKKQIDFWAGLRNDAAHGDLAKVNRENVRLMSQGVALFMQQHGART
ncbi:hypothetical protein ACNOYE_15235 [Nannocystaceae bacterium ST9]